MFPFTYNICPDLFHYFSSGCACVCALYTAYLLERELQFHLVYEIQFIYNHSFTQHFSENRKLTFLAEKNQDRNKFLAPKRAL